MTKEQVKKYKIGNKVVINKLATEENGAKLECDFNELFEITKVLNIGEIAFNLRGLSSGNKVLIREDSEYSFIEDELIVVG